MSATLAMLYDRIHVLLDGPRARGDAEATLTDGYAHALGLEAERLRIERRIGELVRGAATGGPAGGELADLSRRLTAADEELARLRGLLKTLRAHAFGT